MVLSKKKLNCKLWEWFSGEILKQLAGLFVLSHVNSSETELLIYAP